MISHFSKSIYFFNSHIHLGGSLFEDISSNHINLLDFINFSDYWNEILKQKNIDSVAWQTAARYSVIKSKQYGSTGICTMLGANIINELNMQNCLIGFPVMNSKKLAKYLLNLKQNYEKFRKEVLELNMMPGIFLHSVYANDEVVLNTVRDILNIYPNDFLQIHIAEDEETISQVYDKYKMREIELLEKKDLLRENTMLVHCCLLTDDELKVISKYNSKIIICPISNIRVGQTPINPIRLKSFGINWFVATDGLGTGGTLNLRKQAKALKKIYPDVSYRDIYYSISQNPLNLNKEKVDYSNTIELENKAKFLIENCDDNLYKLSKQENELLITLRKELKKYKPTMEDFKLWKEKKM